MTDVKKLSLSELSERFKKKNRSLQIPKVSKENVAFQQSFAQESQWFMEQFANDCRYNVPYSYKIKGIVDIERLEWAINQIIKRHESMRTVFKVEDGKNVQVVEEYKPFKLEIIDCSHEISGRKEVINNLNEKIAMFPFELSVYPLWKFGLIKLEEDEYVFTYTLHHIISDGWSFHVFAKELFALYESDGKPKLPTLDYQYIDYTMWQREKDKSNEYDKQLDYWKSELAESKEIIDLPYDFPKSSNHLHSGDNYFFTVSNEDFETVKEMCLRENITTYHFFVSVFCLLLHQISGDDDLNIGTPFANRNRTEFEDLIGLFINTIVIRSKVDMNESFSAYVQKMKMKSLKAFENAEVPFEKVVSSLEVSGSSENSPLFQVLYVQLNNSEQGKTMAFSDFTVETVPISTKTSQFDLSLYLNIEDEDKDDKEHLARVHGRIEYSTSLFMESTIEEYANDFKKMIREIAKKPDKTIGELIDTLEKKKSNIVVSSSFVSDILNESMDFWKRKLAIPCNTVFAPYSQIFQQFMMKESEMRRNIGGFNVILLRVEDWIQGKYEDYELTLKENVNEFLKLVNTGIIKNLLIYMCPISKHTYNFEHRYRIIREMERKIYRECKGAKLINVTQILNNYSVENFYDPQGDIDWHIPYTREFYTVIGSDIMLRIFTQSIEIDDMLYLIDQSIDEKIRDEIVNKFENDNRTYLMWNPSDKIQEIQNKFDVTLNQILILTKNVTKDILQTKCQYIEFNKIKYLGLI